VTRNPRPPGAEELGEAELGVKPSFWKKPFALWVVFGALVYSALAFLALEATFGFFDPALTVFALIFLVSGILTLRGNRWAILAGTAVSILFIGSFAPILAGTFVNPANPAFWLAVSAIPAFGLVVVFGVLSLVHWKKGIERKPYLASPRSAGGLLTLAVVGFVIGGLVIGNFAAISINKLLLGGGAEADIQIVRDAALPGTAQPFSPATFTVRVGDSVTWFNADVMEHTVTSDAGTPVAFDSPLLNSGDTFSFTFTQAGTYAYHCAPHPTMTGTIIVNP